MTAFGIDADRLRERFDRLSEVGATERGGVDRPALSDENRAARDLLVKWFAEVGLEVRVDGIGNLFARREGRDPEADPVLVGSHVDSQRQGGRFDGVIGVLGGLELVESLSDRGIETERPIEVVSWTNEEGVRFQPDMLGSGVFAGVFDLEEALACEDREGTTVGEELERIGYRGEAVDVDPHSYLELHVEQGPILEDSGTSVGVVEGIAGFSWLEGWVEGRADHAGPTPMDARTDALVPVADLIRGVRDLAGRSDDLVGTVGSVEVAPNSINVIPERVEFTVDLRSPSDEVVEYAVARTEDIVERAAREEGAEHALERIMHVPSVDFESEIVEAVERAAEATGVSHTRLRSGAGHDASYLAGVCPTGMVFVPSVGGVSHTEREYTEWADVVAGTDVLCHAACERAGVEF
ncbi:Zn-dependent hydrolase [Natronorarus salvus]|uniref:Zn-dependent hydrolase n=1 Tax=Natronorarus salvus TaxID=3117733 RepID=UPI002F263BC3